MGSGNLELLIQGDDLARVQEIAENLESRLDAQEDVKFVNPSFEIGKPELIVNVDRVRAAEVGLSVAEV